MHNGEDVVTHNFLQYHQESVSKRESHSFVLPNNPKDHLSMIVNDDQEFKAPKDLSTQIVGFTNDSMREPSLILNNKDTTASSNTAAAQQPNR